jgi:hypothetical protein
MSISQWGLSFHLPSPEKNMQARLGWSCWCVSAALLGACATPAGGPSASADLQARSGSAVSGKVTLQRSHGKLRVEAMVAGLTPGEHGFHVHEVGDCSAPDASAKGISIRPARRTAITQASGTVATCPIWWRMRPAKRFPAKSAASA